MAFPFPLMPRIYMAVKKETREPISEIMSKTPKLPEKAQWGIFLRNHDELTLETVTEEERDYMHAEYAKDPRMRACSRATATRSSCSTPSCCRCRVRPSCTTATRSAWATTSGSRTATPSA